MGAGVMCRTICKQPPSLDSPQAPVLSVARALHGRGGGPNLSTTSWWIKTARWLYGEAFVMNVRNKCAAWILHIVYVP